jgi:formate C-acetyltransferase
VLEDDGPRRGFEIVVGNKSASFFGSPSTRMDGSGLVSRADPKRRVDGRGRRAVSQSRGRAGAAFDQPEDYEALLSIQDYWKNRRITAVADAWQPDGFDELRA